MRHSSSPVQDTWTLSIKLSGPHGLGWCGTVVLAKSDHTPGNYYGAILFDAAPGAQQGLSGYVPFSFTRSSGGDDVADALQPDVVRVLHYSAVQTTLQHVFIDRAGRRHIVFEVDYESAHRR